MLLFSWFYFTVLQSYIQVQKNNDTGNTLIYSYSFDGPTYTNIALYVCKKPTNRRNGLMYPFDMSAYPVNRPTDLSNA